MDVSRWETVQSPLSAAELATLNTYLSRALGVTVAMPSSQTPYGWASALAQLGDQVMHLTDADRIGLERLALEKRKQAQSDPSAYATWRASYPVLASFLDNYRAV